MINFHLVKLHIEVMHIKINSKLIIPDVTTKELLEPGIGPQVSSLVSPEFCVWIAKSSNEDCPWDEVLL